MLTSKTSLHCHQCKSYNDASFIYQGYNINVSNSFEPLAGIPCEDEVLHQTSPPDPFRIPPLAHSTPNSPDTRKNSSKLSLPSTHSSNSDDHSVSNNLRIVIANMNSVRGRKPELSHMCATLKPDIILVSESKLDKSIKSSEFLPLGYSGQLRCDGTAHSGGAMIIHRSDLVIDEVEWDCAPGNYHDQMIWARLTIQNSGQLYIGAYYRSNSANSPDTIDGLKASMKFITDQTCNSPRTTIIIGGDFNVPGIDWENIVVPPGTRNSAMCEELSMSSMQ
jgi:hypothetical protein